jgi:hypothetical protein
MKIFHPRRKDFLNIGDMMDERGHGNNSNQAKEGSNG